MPKVPIAHAPAPLAGRGRARRVTTSLSEINVVPLVDVMLVLLIIFMVTAPMLQRGLEVNLPTSRQATPLVGESLFVTVPASFRTNRIVQLGDEEIRINLLAERVRQALRTQSEKKVYLRGDGGVTLQELIDVMGQLKSAGVEQVGIVAMLPGER